jgi:hypothetical protein
MAGYYFDEQDDSDRDAPLRFAYQTPELVQRLGLRVDNADYEFVLNTILTETCLAAEAGQALSYSRRVEFYRRSRYRPFVFGYTTMMRIVDQIVEAGLCMENRTRPGVRGRQSTIRATPELYEAWLGMGLDPVYDADGETIIIKTRKTQHTPAQLLEYVDTMKHVGLRSALQPVNEMAADMKIGGLGAYHVRPDLLRFEKRALDKYGRQVTRIQHVRMVPGNGGRRLFCENLNQHGRFYFWPQNLPKAARTGITINNEPTAEIDYRAHHLRLAYSQSAQIIDGDDEYDVGHGFERNHVKAAALIGLNATDRKSATRALAQGKEIRYSQAAKVFDAVLDRHRPIARAFFSDFGIKIMRTDADMILGVTTGLAAAGIPSIPVHDSVIVQARFASEAKAKMEENWHRFAGSVNDCKLKQIR